MPSFKEMSFYAPNEQGSYGRNTVAEENERMYSVEALDEDIRRSVEGFFEMMDDPSTDPRAPRGGGERVRHNENR